MAQDPKTRPVGNGLTMAAGAWSFSGDVCEVFEQHIRRSVPGYDALHQAVVDFAQGHLEGLKATVCELGSSTGTLTRRLAQALPSARIIGIELEASMVAAAEQYSLASSTIDYRCADARSFAPPKTDLFVACYTLQFLPVNERLPLLKRLYGALRPGGALFLAEKIVWDDPVRQQRAKRSLVEFKRGQGFSDAEIRAKEKSLEGVLVPLDEQQYPRWLEGVGFERVERAFSVSAFAAWTAQKPWA